MEYIIAILVGLGIIWAVYYYCNKAEEKQDEKLSDAALTEEKSSSASSTSKEYKPASSLTWEESSPVLSAANECIQVSLDQLYAKSHGMWVCQYCETLNDAGKEDCSACGAKKR